MKRIYNFITFLLIVLIAFGNSVVADEDSDKSDSSDNSGNSEDSDSSDSGSRDSDSETEDDSSDDSDISDRKDSPDEKDEDDSDEKVREELKQRKEALREDAKQEREKIREETKDRIEELKEGRKEKLEILRRFINEEGKEVKIELKREFKDGREEIKRKISVGESEFETELEIDEEANDKEVRVKLSNGNNQDIKVMPDRASEVALRVLESKGVNLELREIGNEEKRAVYEARVEKQGRILGLFRAKAELSTRIDPDTGEVLEIKKPWWFFLVNNAEDVAESPAELDTVLAGEQPTGADEDLAAV